SYPEERLLYILADSQAKVFITEQAMADRFQSVSAKTIYLDSAEYTSSAALWPKENLPRINTSVDLCYVIYTSGSTGKPKGAANEHKGVVNRILWMQDTYRLKSSDRVLQKTPFGFDVSVWEFFWPLMVGATLVMAEPNIHKDAEGLANLIEREKITIIHFVPSMLNLFLEAEVADKCHSLRHVFASGEALSHSHQTRFYNQFKAKLHNLYGPTEAAIDVTYWPCDSLDERTIVPIGYPIANIQMYILDEFLQPVAIGVLGELFIGGVGLARGYIHREELTREKFIPHPFFPNKRLYRTGDLCRFLPDGAIDYVGRIDNQIKLRGFRIELGEIEASIRKLNVVKEVVVIAREDIPTQKYLAAYLIAEGNHEAIKQHLIAELSSSLPEYMLPTAFVFVDHFPLSPNGKLDMKRLPKPEKNVRTREQIYIAPRTDLEQSLQSLWRQVLGIEQIGIQDHFFAIGGHSLQAMELVLKIKRHCKKAITLSEIFLYPTIEDQSRLLENRASIQEIQSSIQMRPEKRFEPFQLTDIQRAYFVGRTNAFALGNICSHIYVENKREMIDLVRLEKALNLLIDRHDMLRAIILDDGTQKVLKKTPYYRIQVHNGPDALDTRRIMTEKHKLTSNWPLFEVRCSYLDEGKVVVHFYFELLIADGTGLEVIFEELSLLYQSPEVQLPPIGVTYRDCVEALDQENEEFERAKQYWFNRIDRLPEAPELPTRFVQSGKDPHFVRRKGGLSRENWKQLQEEAARMGVTVAALLVTIYGEILKIWSKSAHFTLNLMFFNRTPLHT
ncbi:MAG: amino acid adenylation domain-containing protein, partial [Chlamydiales bacterium]